MFKDRFQAGQLLARQLRKFENSDAVILAIPRGGLPVGAVISKELKLPLEVVFTKKIGHPFNKEFAIGAVSLNNFFLDSDISNIPLEYFEAEIERIQILLKEKQQKFYQNRKARNLKNKILIVVDDGIATGNTIMATAQLLKKESPSKIVVAVPVAPASVIQKISSNPNINEVICLDQPDNFRGVGQFFENFDQVNDQQAIELFQIANKNFEENY